MEKYEIEKLRSLPIEGVAERLGLKVTRHKTRCPFHDDSNPSLSFHIRTNTYKCFVCDAHGSSIDLAMQVLGKDFKETCQWLADEHCVIITSYHPERSEDVLLRTSSEKSESTLDVQKYSKYFQHPFLNQAARTFLFTERKLHPGVINWCKLTSWTDRYGTSWLQIPYFDVDGNLIGVQNRRLGKGEGPRFRFPRGSHCRIYNLPVLKLLKEGEELWIAEGCSDCWALLSSGKKAIAIPSATLLKTKDLEILKTYHSKLIIHNLHMYPDSDIPGEKLFLQLQAHCPQIVRHSLPTGCKDFSEYYCNIITHNS